MLLLAAYQNYCTHDNHVVYHSCLKSEGSVASAQETCPPDDHVEVAAGHEVGVIPAPEQVHSETVSGLGVAADEW